ncbi:integumentary mucin C.1-like [Ctenocephalides felis]|uniref:integumentary mucin C.1-like n=1 Tax=Ctenocephalides felis TaxID=7515 RepID=UPI000E6E320F|nr:integumentary mucin C.1-like [Ctenocephalides felis]
MIKSVIIVANFWLFVALQSIDNRQTNNCSEIGVDGFFCLNCSVTAFCGRGPTGEFNTVSTSPCSSGEVCSTWAGRCSADPSPCFSEGSITCTGPGVFPDPYDCQRYHECKTANESSKPVECGGYKAYNVIENNCSLNMNHQSCKRLQFHCDTIGDENAWPSNRNIYYRCTEKTLWFNSNKILYPLLYRCDENEIYDAVQRVCVRDETTTTPATTPTESSTSSETTTTSATTSTESSTSSETTTTSATTPTESSTSSETTTTSATTPTESSTSSETTTTSATTPTESSTSSETTTTSATTPTESSTSGETTTTSATTPTEPSTKPTSTETPATKPPQEIPCKQQGPLMQDPHDCHAYYTCLEIGSLPKHFNCNKGAYFNTVKLKCVKGNCENSTEIPLPELPDICDEVGPLVQDPNDCRKYYSCVTIGKEPEHFTCNKGAYFDRERLRCVRGSC